ncbi:MAG: hypothetical protein ACJ74W_11925 [Pyrinomonadaceae bacterium]|jgi:hypothetical protein
MKILGALAPAWMIIIGALMIIPYNGGVIVECIACGLLVTRILGVISILIGVGALAGRRGTGAG